MLSVYEFPKDVIISACFWLAAAFCTVCGQGSFLRFFQADLVNAADEIQPSFDAGQRQNEKETCEDRQLWRKQQTCERTVKHGRTNSANSSIPARRGDKWAAGPNQMFRQGYLLRSIDRYQPRVRLTSPPYLVTLRHPTPLSLRTGMSNEDTRLDGRRNEDREKTRQGEV